MHQPTNQPNPPCTAKIDGKTCGQPTIKLGTKRQGTIRKQRYQCTKGHVTYEDLSE